MAYTVRCHIDECPFEERTVENVEKIFDLQDSHQEQLGDHHILEFELVEEES